MEKERGAKLGAELGAHFIFADLSEVSGVHLKVLDDLVLEVVLLDSGLQLAPGLRIMDLGFSEAVHGLADAFSVDVIRLCVQDRQQHLLDHLLRFRGLSHTVSREQVDGVGSERNRHVEVLALVNSE